MRMKLVNKQLVALQTRGEDFQESEEKRGVISCKADCKIFVWTGAIGSHLQNKLRSLKLPS